MSRVLVTGCAGFIGFHVCRRLLASGHAVLGIDNLNPFYNEGLKDARLKILEKTSGFEFARGELADLAWVQELFARQQFGPIIHLAAQAGVRYSLENPHLYVQSNLVAFVNLLESARAKKTPHFVYASSSSVYGANKQMPFSVRDSVDHPVSLYAATKKTDELMAHVYAHLYDVPSTGLRFFTVYGPWGRPDMALFIFTQAILEGRPIDVYNYGRMRRDFTYIDDIVEGIVRVSERIPEPDPEWDGEILGPGTSSAPYRIYNIGNSDPVELEEFIAIVEQKLGRKAQRRPLPLQQGDVPATFADVADLERDIGFKPRTSLREGIGRFVDWYLEYYGSKELVGARTHRLFADSLEQVTVETLTPDEADALIGANR